MKYKRILLKLSGEVLKGSSSDSVSGEVLMNFAKELKELQKKGFQIGIVIGGGNIWRFRDFKSLKIDRVSSDTMGMLATLINSLALESALRSLSADVRTMSNLPCKKAMETFTQKKAEHHMKKGRIVIFAGGTGNPYFTTDSAAALKALEMKCDVLMKATKVDYVYDKDPVKFKNAKKYEKMSFKEVMDKNLGVMDMTCAELCEEGHIPMLVFNVNKAGNLKKAFSGQKIGTLIS